MKSNRINSGLTLASNIGVVIGLFLVAYQINQETELTKAQLFSDHTNARREWAQTMMGSDPMAVVAKSIERPQDLTLAELHVMDMYFISTINEMRRLEVLKKAGLDMGAAVESMQVFYFGSNFAKAWFAEYGEHEIHGVDEKIQAVDPEWTVSFFNRVLDRVDERTGQSLARDKAAP